MHQKTPRLSINQNKRMLTTYARCCPEEREQASRRLRYILQDLLPRLQRPAFKSKISWGQWKETIKMHDEIGMVT